MIKWKTILTVVLIGVIFAPLIFAGVRAANDFPSVTRDIVSFGFNLPQAWSFRGGNGLGENIVFTLGSWPIDLLFGFGSSLGLSFSLLTRIIFLIPTVLLGVFSIKKLLFKLEIGTEGQLAGILLYLLNTYVLLLIDGGQLSLALAYSFFPLVYLCFLNAKTGTWKERIRLSLAVTLLGIFDIRFLYIFFIVVGSKFCFDLFYSSKSKYISLLKTYSLLFVVVGTSLLLFNLYWIIPFVSMKNTAIPTFLSDVSQLSNLNFTNLFNSVMLQQPNWPLNSFGLVTPPVWYFTFIFIATFCVFFKKRIKREQLFFVFLFLIGAFLAKGANEPFGNVYTFLFEHFPGFFMFRDSSKFLLLVALSISVLIPFTFEKKKFFFVSLCLYLFLVLSPVWMGKMTGMFAPEPNETDYANVSTEISSDTHFGRILWLPSRPPLGFSSLLHPSLDGLTLAGERPFDMANVGSYERFNFLRDSSYAKDLLQIAGVSYVGYPFPDERRQKLKTEDLDYYATFSSQLQKKDWVESKISEPPAQVFKTNVAPSLFSISDKLWWVLGSDEIFTDIKKIPNATLLNNPIVFLEEDPSVVRRFSEDNFGKIILYHRTDDDLIASFFPSSRYIKLDNSLTFENGKKLWKVDTSNPSSWREFLQTKYQNDNDDFSSGAYVSEGGGNYQLRLPDTTSDSLLFMRVFVSNRGGSIQLSGATTGVVNTLDLKPRRFSWGIPSSKEGVTEYNKGDFHWFILPVSQSGSLHLAVSGDINALSSVFVISKSQYSEIQQSIEVLKKSGAVVNWDNLTDNDKKQMFETSKNTAVSSNMNAATSYSVDLQNKEGIYTLLFSQSYDPGWELNGNEPLRLYSLTNGYVIRAGSLNALSYAPEQYVFPSILFLELVFLLVFVSIAI